MAADVSGRSSRFDGGDGGGDTDGVASSSELAGAFVQQLAFPSAQQQLPQRAAPPAELEVHRRDQQQQQLRLAEVTQIVQQLESTERQFWSLSFLQAPKFILEKLSRVQHWLSTRAILDHDDAEFASSVPSLEAVEAVEEDNNNNRSPAEHSPLPPSPSPPMAVAPDGTAGQRLRLRRRRHFLRALQTLVSCRLDSVRLMVRLGDGSLSGCRVCKEVCESHLQKLRQLSRPIHPALRELLRHSRRQLWLLVKLCEIQLAVCDLQFERSVWFMSACLRELPRVPHLVFRNWVRVFASALLDKASFYFLRPLQSLTGGVDWDRLLPHTFVLEGVLDGCGSSSGRPRDSSSVPSSPTPPLAWSSSALSTHSLRDLPLQHTAGTISRMQAASPSGASPDGGPTLAATPSVGMATTTAAAVTTAFGRQLPGIASPGTSPVELPTAGGAARLDYDALLRRFLFHSGAAFGCMVRSRKHTAAAAIAAATTTRIFSPEAALEPPLDPLTAVDTGGQGIPPDIPNAEPGLLRPSELGLRWVTQLEEDQLELAELQRLQQFHPMNIPPRTLAAAVAELDDPATLGLLELPLPQAVPGEDPFFDTSFASTAKGPAGWECLWGRLPECYWESLTSLLGSSLCPGLGHADGFVDRKLLLSEPVAGARDEAASTVPAMASPRNPNVELGTGAMTSDDHLRRRKVSVGQHGFQAEQQQQQQQLPLTVGVTYLVIRMEEQLYLVMGWRGVLPLALISSYRRHATRIVSHIRSLP